MFVAIRLCVTDDIDASGEMTTGKTVYTERVAMFERLSDAEKITDMGDICLVDTDTGEVVQNAGIQVKS